jgi:hypothetical protein
VTLACRLGARPGRSTVNLGSGSGLDPATQSGQCLPAGVGMILLAGARLIVAVLAAARAKSLAVGLAQGADRQGQKHLLAQHIFKQQTVFLIIPDFGFARRDGAFRRPGVDAEGAKDQVEIGLQRHPHRLDATGAGNFELADKVALEADIGDDLLGSAVFVDDFGAAFGGQIALLIGFFAVVDGSWFELEVEVNRFLFQFGDLEFHTVKRVRRGRPRVNWRGMYAK